MAFALSDLGLTFDRVINGADMFLANSSPWTDFETKKVLGVKYKIKIPEYCISITAKVAEVNPVVSNEEIKKSAKPIKVSIIGDNPVSFRGDNLFNVDMSVIAERVEVVKAAAHKGFPDTTPPVTK